MDITISQPVAPNSATNSYDILKVKKALNRIGLYTPPQDIGITDIPDTALFNAIKQFQENSGLPKTGTLKPDDDTMKLLNKAITQPPKGFYIWRTVNDNKVRPEHAKLNGTVRTWDSIPNPGDDFGCRCWVEHIQVPKDIVTSLNKALNKLDEFDREKYDLSAKLLRHYLGGTGERIELRTNELENIDIVQSAISKNQERFKNSFLGKEKFGEYYKPNSLYRSFINLPDNSKITFSDYWDVDFQKSNPKVWLEADFIRAIGSGKLRSKGDFQISRKGDTIYIIGKISNQINDIYDFNTDTFFDRKAFQDYKLLADKGYAKPFTINWKKELPFAGTITIRNKRIVNSNFE